MTPPARRPPFAVLAPAGLGVALVIVPIVGLLQRAPWSSLLDRLGSDTVLEAIRVSLVVSVVAAALSLVLGLPLAWLLARHDGRLVGLVRAAVLVPMVLPPVVGGTALLFALGRRGLVGQWLDSWFGVTLPFTTAGAIVAATWNRVDATLEDGPFDQAVQAAVDLLAAGAADGSER